MNEPLHIGLVPLARPTFDTALASEVLAQVRTALAAASDDATGSPCVLHGPEELVMDMPALQAAAGALAGVPLDLLVALQASFADSSMVVELAGKLAAPLLLWAVPEERTGGRLRLNSFCGINLAGHGLRRAGFSYDYLYAAPGDPATAHRVLALAHAGRVARLLRSARIGRVGRNPDGFDPCRYDGEALETKLGVKVVQHEVNELFAQVRALPAAAIEPVMTDLGRRIEGLDALDQNALRGTAASYVALRRLAAAEGLAGLAVRCWPEFFTDLGCAACGAMSLLMDDMIPCSCEADVNGTVTQLMLQWLSGGEAFGTDMVGFDVERDEAVVWHCGQAPTAMADPDVRPRGTVHSNRRLPLLMEFPLKPGRVTLARLSESTGEYRLVVGSGQMLRASMSFTGTSGVMRFDRPAAEVLDTIMVEGLDHHISLTYGDHLEPLLAVAKMLKLPVLRLA